MATFITSKNLLISVDPGFDSTKITVNGLIFDIPNAIMDVTGKTKEFLELDGTVKKSSGYLVSRYIPNKEYMVGELARKSQMERSEREDYIAKHDMMDSKNRFETTDFEVNLMTCIGAALVRYAKESVEKHLKPEIDLTNEKVLEDFRIFIGIALPNDWVDDVQPNIRKFVAGKHSYSIETEDGNFMLNYTVLENNVVFASQAVCALIGTAYTDDGQLRPNSDTLNNLPAIIIDGGYKTVGIFQLTTANRVADAESNTDFAMNNIHKEVARKLREEYGRTNIHDFMIPAILENGGRINYLAFKKGEDNSQVSAKTVDVNMILAEVQEDVCSQLIEYMNVKYESFLDVKSIIITGGTGAAYYNQMVKFFSEQREYLAGKVILTDYEFLGAKINPIFGVSVGLYKVLRNQLAKTFKRERVEGETVVEVSREKTSKKENKDASSEGTTTRNEALNRIKNKPSNGVVPVIDKDEEE